MSHIYHADLGDPARPAILVDGCPSCESHATHLYELDEHFIRALWLKTIAVERPPEGTVHDRYRSHAEKKACATLWTLILLLERCTTVDPWTLMAGVGAPA